MLTCMHMHTVPFCLICCSGVPYVEDYYYQAYVNKHTNGANAPAFEPQVSAFQ